jgi:hypothetical protein
MWNSVKVLGSDKKVQGDVNGYIAGLSIRIVKDSENKDDKSMDSNLIILFNKLLDFILSLREGDNNIQKEKICHEVELPLSRMGYGGFTGIGDSERSVVIAGPDLTPSKTRDANKNKAMKD